MAVRYKIRLTNQQSVDIEAEAIDVQEFLIEGSASGSKVTARFLREKNELSKVAETYGPVIAAIDSRDEKKRQMKEYLERSEVLEVFFDLCSDVSYMMGKKDPKIEVLAQESTRDRLDRLIYWTNEFREIYKNTDWNNTDYFEQQEDFLTQKIEEQRRLFSAR